jgi:hypothetical protein
MEDAMAKVDAGIGSSKSALKKGIGKLRKALKTKGLSEKHKIVYKKAIFDMTLAYILLNKIPCTQPLMSFEIPPYSARRSQSSRSARRGR